MDIKLYVDTDADLRIIRRMLRDIKERGVRLSQLLINTYLSFARCIISLLNQQNVMQILSFLKAVKTT